MIFSVKVPKTSYSLLIPAIILNHALRESRREVLCKKVLKISQNSQEYTC